MTENTITVSVRLSKKDANRLKNKAIENNMTKAILLKKIILDYLDKDITHTNILQEQMINLNEKIDKLDTKNEFFEQLFYTFLENWFAAHPRIDNSDNSILHKAAVNRRNEFIRIFISDIYNDNGELYDILFANHVEGETDE